MLMRAASVGGPFAGGVLYALGGGRLTYALCFVGFALGTVLLSRVVTLQARNAAAATGTMWKRFGAGIRFIRSRPIILGTISLIFCGAAGRCGGLCCPSTPAKCCT